MPDQADQAAEQMVVPNQTGQTHLLTQAVVAADQAPQDLLLFHIQAAQAALES
jgi:hypothetical protein